MTPETPWQATFRKQRERYPYIAVLTNETESHILRAPGGYAYTWANREDAEASALGTLAMPEWSRFTGYEIIDCTAPAEAQDIEP